MKLAFRITGKLRPGQQQKPLPGQLPAINVDKEAICKSCEWLHKDLNRCTRPNSKQWAVCYTSAARVEPWKKLRVCPVWNESLATETKKRNKKL